MDGENRRWCIPSDQGAWLSCEWWIPCRQRCIAEDAELSHVSSVLKTLLLCILIFLQNELYLRKMQCILIVCLLVGTSYAITGSASLSQNMASQRGTSTTNSECHVLYVSMWQKKIGLWIVGRYDRARGVEIGNKDIKLEHLEEDYTTSNWIARIYRVKPPTNRLWDTFKRFHLTEYGFR